MFLIDDQETVGCTYTLLYIYIFARVECLHVKISQWCIGSKFLSEAFSVYITQTRWPKWIGFWTLDLSLGQGHCSSVCCVLGQDMVLLQVLSPLRNVTQYRLITKKT